MISRGFTVACSLLIVACGARSPLDELEGGTSSGGGGAACAGGSLVLTSEVVLDEGGSQSEPEGSPTIAWSGTRLFVGWAQWAQGGYTFHVTAADIGDSGLAFGPHATLEPGETNNPFNPHIAWSRDRLDFFWAQDDGSILGQGFDAGLAGTSAPETIIPPSSSQQTIVTNALGGDQTLLVWAEQQANGGFSTLAAALSDGQIAGGPEILYGGSGYDLGAALARHGDGVFALWGTHPTTDPQAPISAILATIDPTSGAVLTTQTLDEAADRYPTSVAVEGDRVSVAIYDVAENRVVIRSRPVAGGAFTERASFEASAGVGIAAGPCGGLVALVPTGEYSPNNPLPTGISLIPIGSQGAVGTPLALPVTRDYLDNARFIPVDGGFVVAWIEGDQSAIPSRTLHAAFVAVR